MQSSAGDEMCGSGDLHRLLAIVISLQKEAQIQGSQSALVPAHVEVTSAEAQIERGITGPLAQHPLLSTNKFQVLLLLGMLLVALGSGWTTDWYFRRTPAPSQGTFDALNINAVVDQIIKVESNGDPNAKNKRSSAAGLGQFLDETWLLLIRAYRPDLSKQRTEGEILALRRDPSVAREITARFTERNAHVLRKRGLPVTPGTLYLAHFAGAAGAVAILSALEEAHAASVMAGADATGRTRPEKLIKANPFLARFTVADLKSWADRKMRTNRS
jgi:hypothetical protein